CSSGDKGVVNFTLSYIFPLIERQIYRRYTFTLSYIFPLIERQIYRRYTFTLSYIFPLIERQIYRRYTYFHKVIKTSQEHFEVNAHLFMYVKMCDKIYENRCGCIKLL
uniref:Uncharacterized protein n=1 Tax=Glossina palpalis gambiensis TaxID=67801 RepID=A0A1B0BJ99_9MUSC